MFNLDNKEKIMDLVNRKGNHIVIPLYVSIGNLRYGLLEIEHIRNVTMNSFKVGFGCINTLFSKTPVFKCQDMLQYCQEVRSFHWFDYDQSMDYVYYTFECNQSTCDSLMDMYKNNTDMMNVLNEISMYTEKLYGYVVDIVDQYRKRCIERFNQENEDKDE